MKNQINGKSPYILVNQNLQEKGKVLKIRLKSVKNIFIINIK